MLPNEIRSVAKHTFWVTHRRYITMSRGFTNEILVIGVCVPITVKERRADEWVSGLRESTFNDVLHLGADFSTINLHPDPIEQSSRSK